MRRVDALVQALRDPQLFSTNVLHRALRRYQLAPARAVLAAVLAGAGGTFAVMMARQSGKNETSAQLEAMLLLNYVGRGGTIIKTAPTLTPQLVNSLERLGAICRLTPLLSFARVQGNSIELGEARFRALSGSEAANVVGATADILLECDEAQDVEAEIWNKRFRPMAASTNAVSVLWGTPWTSRTLLATTIAELREQERKDKVRRVFTANWRDVAAVVPAYGRYVEGEIARLGPDHPLIKTQYELQTIDEEAGLFPPAVQVLMRGRHPRQRGPDRGRSYAFLLDVAGGVEEPAPDDEVRVLEPRRDATALTVVEMATEPTSRQIHYLVVDRYWWSGRDAVDLFGAVLSLAETWEPAYLVVDATGLGSGLSSFLSKTLGPRVLPFVFGSKSKSDLGWQFLGMCSAGRFHDHAADGSAEQVQFWREVAECEYETLPGPGHLIRWGVADPTLHDDLLVSAALCAVIDAEVGAVPQSSHVIEAEDPLAALHG